MAGFVTEQGRDGKGDPLDLRFYQNDDGTRIPVQASVILGPDGNPVTSLATRDDDVRAAVEALLAKVSGDQATEATLDAILQKVSADPATQTTLAALLTQAESLATQATLAEVRSVLEDVKAALEGQAAGTGADPTTAVLSGSSLDDTESLPIRFSVRSATIANAVAITTAGPHRFNLLDVISEEEVRRARRFRITIYDTHDQTPGLSLYGNHDASGPGSQSRSAGTLFATNSPYDYGRCIIQSTAGGAGANETGFHVVPALADLVGANLAVQVNYGTAPTTGSVTIVVDCGY